MMVCILILAQYTDLSRELSHHISWCGSQEDVEIKNPSSCSEGYSWIGVQNNI